MAVAPPSEALLDLDSVLPAARFTEVHRRTISAPIDVVWPAALAVTPREVRTLGPLLAMRQLPKLFRRRTVESTNASQADRSLLEVFEDGGFVMLRKDTSPADGRAAVVFGGAGKFWSPTNNDALTFSGPADFLAFDEPGHAVTAALLEAQDNGDGTTTLITETRVDGTDAAAAAKFAPYWALIRLPSGLIRRSWLAAADRRACRT